MSWKLWKYDIRRPFQPLSLGGSSTLWFPCPLLIPPNPSQAFPSLPFLPYPSLSSLPSQFLLLCLPYSRGSRARYGVQQWVSAGWGSCGVQRCPLYTIVHISFFSLSCLHVFKRFYAILFFERFDVHRKKKIKEKNEKVEMRRKYNRTKGRRKNENKNKGKQNEK